MTDRANITLGDTKLEAPVVVGTEDEHAIDIAQLRAKTGYVTIDPAFMNTASTKSAITFIDGDKGILRYRGIPIEQLAEHSTFVETAYLLIYGDLPKEAQLERVERQADAPLAAARGHEALLRGLLLRRAHPMAISERDGGPLSSYYPDSLDVDNVEQRDITIARVVSKVRTIAAFAYKKSIGQPFVYPKNSLCLLRELPQHDVLGPGRRVRNRPRAREGHELAPDPARGPRAELFDETVRVVGSSKANLFASISAGICALWGPLHGGANQEVLEMLDRDPGRTAVT